jgi:membrane protease YdiL (CAAX protease family)
MAILPAAGEELFFRGILMRFIKKRSRSITFPIIISALMFALVHFSVYGFVPILLSGILLGLIYYLTGSILCSMLFHMLNNGLQIIAVYMGNSNPAIKHAIDSNWVPPYILIGGLLLAGISLYLLWKNRTPLPPDWANDYTQEEIAAEKQVDS